jgi:hypothetical protein
MEKIAMYKEAIYKEARKNYTEYTFGDKDKSQSIYYKKPSLLRKVVGNVQYKPTSQADSIVLSDKDYKDIENKMSAGAYKDNKDAKKLTNEYVGKATKRNSYTLMEPNPVIIGKKRWKNITSDPLYYSNVSTKEGYNSLYPDLAKMEATNYGKMKASHKVWKQYQKTKEANKMDKKAYLDMIYENAYKMEKDAGILSSALSAGKALLSSEKAINAINTVKKGYNAVAKTGLGKKMLIGAGIGTAMNTANYDKNQDDGSFGKSLLGKALTGAAGGAVGGAVAHKVLKPATLNFPAPPAINPSNFVDAEYHVAWEYVDYMYNMEKEAAVALLASPKNMFEKFKDLSPWQRMAIGTIIGAGTKAATFKKPKEEPKKDDDDDDDNDMKQSLIRKAPGVGDALRFADNINNKLNQTRGGAALKGANIGAALGYTIGNPNRKL